MGWKGKFKIFKVGSASYITARAGSKLKKSRPDLASLHIFFTFAHFCFQWFLPSREQHHHLSAKILDGCDEKLECLGSWGQSNEIVHHELVSSEFYNRLWSIYKYDIVNKLIKSSNAMEELKNFYHLIVRWPMCEDLFTRKKHVHKACILKMFVVFVGSVPGEIKREILSFAFSSYFLSFYST